MPRHILLRYGRYAVLGSSIGLSAPLAAQWQTEDVASTASFRGLSVVSDRVVWASGTRGTVVRTTDGGRTWRVMNVPGADSLDFRDVEAFDDRRAYGRIARWVGPPGEVAPAELRIRVRKEP